MYNNTFFNRTDILLSLNRYVDDATATSTWQIELR